MTQPNRHRIQRQVIDLAVGSGMPAPLMQEALSRSYWEHVVPELTSVFDEAAGADELLRFDRLELDLGTIVGADWEPQFCRRLISELTRQIGAHGAESARRENTATGSATAPEPLRQFLFFLAHGRLPWWAERPTSDFNELFSKRLASGQWRMLHAALLAEPRARVRCVDTLSDETLALAVTAWCGLENATLVLARLTPASLPPKCVPEWRRRFWLTLTDWVLSGAPDPSRGTELMRALLELQRAYASLQGGQDSALHAAVSGRMMPRESSELVGEELPSPWREWWARVERLAPAQSVRIGGGAPAANSLPPSSALAVHKERERLHELTADAQPVYLPCAGAILLHPFLETLFRDRRLLEGRYFRDPAARQHAVHMVGYLGFGQVEVPEYDLGIAKVLCGLPLDEPIEIAALDADDLAACNALLDAVLEHWSALRSSSPGWIRTQFLLREGKLESADSGLRLTVERRAQDVLLARLPWGFGVISLPWTCERIFVRWLD